LTQFHCSAPAYVASGETEYGTASVGVSPIAALEPGCERMGIPSRPPGVAAGWRFVVVDGASVGAAASRFS
jgi:hypothetical protein